VLAVYEHTHRAVLQNQAPFSFKFSSPRRLTRPNYFRKRICMNFNYRHSAFDQMNDLKARS
jgi:hypothetical protein